MPQAFLQFGDAISRRKAHAKNEKQPWLKKSAVGSRARTRDGKSIEGTSWIASCSFTTVSAPVGSELHKASPLALPRICQGSQHSLAEAIQQCHFSTYEMAARKAEDPAEQCAVRKPTLCVSSLGFI